MADVRLHFASFCERSGRKPEELIDTVATVRGDAWLAGGAIRRTLIGHELDSDFDFFFRSQEHLDAWRSALPPAMKLVKETPHHLQFFGTLDGKDKPITVQAIRFKFYMSAADVIDSFDYTITQFALDGADMVTTAEALWDLGRKRLAVHKITYPVASMRRLLKYGTQGFTACAGCMSELLRQTAATPDLHAALQTTYVD